MVFLRVHRIALLFVLAFLLPDGVTAQQVRILYYSSAPEVIRGGDRPGLPQVAAAVRKEREKANNVLFVHGGASLGPSVLGALDRGAHMIDVLNMLEPDLMAVGKREFSYGEDQLTLHALAAGFPFVGSNLVRRSNQQPIEGVEPTYILNIEGMRIGFIALTSENTIAQYAVQALSALPLDASVRERAAELRADGADAIILFADTDYNDLSVYTRDNTVNAIFYAHNFDNPYSVDAGGITIKEGALDGKMVALTLTKSSADSGSKLESSLETIDLHSIKRDPEISALIHSYSSRLDLLLKQKIGEISRSFNTIRTEVRTKESAFGNLVADAVRDAMQADVAFLNSGGIRGNRYYETGHILTREDIQMEMPFNNTVELFEMTGRQIRQALERGLSCIDLMDGCFLQVSNIKMRYDPNQAVGSRVIDILVGGTPLKPEASYRVGTLNFLARGGDGFDMLQNSPRLTRVGSGKLLWEVVASYLQAQPVIAPSIEGRLVSSPDYTHTQK